MAKQTSMRSMDCATDQAFHEAVTGKAISGLPAPAPCPFCKFSEWTAIVTCRGELDGDGNDTTTYHVQCDGCGAEGPAASSQLEAALPWNAATQDMDAALGKAIWHQQRLVWQAQAVVQCVSHSLDRHFGDWPAKLPPWNLALDTADQMLGRIASNLDDQVLMDAAAEIEREAQAEAAHDTAQGGAE